MKKRLWSILLALCMVLSLLPFGAMTASAADIIESGTCGDNVTWTLDSDGLLTISGTGEMWNYIRYVDIPTNTFVGESCSIVRSVVIESGVTSIGNSAFAGCSNLTKITIPDSVTSIGEDAFFGCSSLKSVTIPASVTRIQAVAFRECSSLVSVTIPASVTLVEQEAFYKCESLTSINVAPGNPNYISVDGVLFNKDQTSLVQFPGGRSGGYVIPDGVTDIGSAFEGCSSLTSVTIPNSVTNISYYTFDGCSSLTSIEVIAGNPSFRSIDGVVFSKDEKTIICYPRGRSGDYQIPQGVTSIDEYAFYNCTGLTAVRIPHSVSSIGIDAFHACKDLRAIQVEESNPSYSSVDGVLFSKDQKTLIKCPGGKTGAFVIPDSVTVIESAAFSVCTGLTDVKIPKSVAGISYNSFYGCTGLTSIVIPDGVTHIDSWAFAGCENLRDVAFPHSLQKISFASFFSCGIKDIWYAGTKEQWYEIDSWGYDSDDDSGFFGTGATEHYNVHTYTDLTPVAAADPTCTKDGTAAYWKCEGCGKLFSDAAGTSEIAAPAVVPALGHTWGAWSVTKPATETAEGVETRTCSVCGETETRAIPPLSHTHKLTAVAAVAPTCTKDGTAAYWKCEGCGKLFSDAAGKNEIAAPAAVPATGHKWDSGKVTKQPTETAEGVKTFTCTVCGETRTEAIPKLTPKPAENPFTDVPENQYYYEPVLWAVNHDPQITNGTGDGKFSPNDTCIRGQIVTFLWRAKGCPEPKSTVNPFSDVFPSDYYYKAVLWANENDITNGTGGGKFSPNDGCTRDQVVTFLWRTEGKPKVEAVNPFVDVPAGQYYTDAVLWAVSRNITNGTDATHFSPQKTCTRGEIVTFLYRDLA